MNQFFFLFSFFFILYFILLLYYIIFCLILFYSIFYFIYFWSYLTWNPAWALSPAEQSTVSLEIVSLLEAASQGALSQLSQQFHRSAWFSIVSMEDLSFGDSALVKSQTCLLSSLSNRSSQGHPPLSRSEGWPPWHCRESWGEALVRTSTYRAFSLFTLK